MVRKQLAIQKQNESSQLEGDLSESLSGESMNDKLSSNLNDVADSAQVGKHLRLSDSDSIKADTEEVNNL